MDQRVSLVTLGVADTKKARAFYKALGWEGKSPDGDVVFYEAGGTVFSVWGREDLAKDSAVTDNGGWGGVTLAHNVGSDEEVDAIIEEARVAGATIAREPGKTFYGGYAGVFHDPDGHPWEISHNPGFELDKDGAVVLPDLTTSFSEVQIRLITPDLELVDAAIADPESLDEALGCDVAEGWLVFPEALSRAREEFAQDPSSARWGMRFFLTDEPYELVGFGGFKGPPDHAMVQLGYAVAPDREGRGIATAAVREMIKDAFEEPDVTAVIADTLAEENASGRVLEKNDFTHLGSGPEGGDIETWRWVHSRSPDQVLGSPP